MTSGERDLDALLRGARPVLAHPEVVFVTLTSPVPAALATVMEEEGLTVVLERAEADRLGLAYDWVGAWITLRVHSALEAIGLTAAVSATLADRGISCNVLAGRHHDHLIVPADRAADALAVLAGIGRT